jgi:hypothetical protein
VILAIFGGIALAVIAGIVVWGQLHPVAASSVHIRHECVKYCF